MLAVLAAALAAQSTAAADPSARMPVCDEAGCVVELMRGETAPFNGQLLSPELAIAVASRANDCAAVIEIELARSSSIARADLVASERRAAAEIDALRRIVKTTQEDRDLYRAESARRVEPPHWTASPWFVASVSVLATIGLIAGGSALMHALP